MKYALHLILFCLSLPLMSQPVAQFSTTERNMGDIGWLTPTTTTFEVKNTGDQPLLILDVRTDCGCAKAIWENEEIKPGELARISVTYNAELLGTFQKYISVTTNAEEHPTDLLIKGRVVKEISFDTNDFNIHIGDFHLNTDEIDFDDVKMGSTPKAVITIMNAGARALHPEFMHMPDYLTAITAPDIISPGAVGEITFFLNTKLIKDFGLTQTTIYLSRFVGDKISDENALQVSATILPTLPSTKRLFKYAPCLEISDTTLVFPAFEAKKKLKKTVMLKNTGNAPLDISRLQVYNPGIGVTLNKSTLQPGEEVKLKVTLHNTKNKRGKRNILLITNDPKRPKMILRIEQDSSTK